MNLSKKADEALKLNNWDLAVARYSQICKKHPEDLSCQQKYNLAKVKAAHQHYEKAEILFKNRYAEEALVELEIAADLLPNDPVIQEKLKDIRDYIVAENRVKREQQEAQTFGSVILSGAQEPGLSLKSDEPLDMHFDNVSFKTILQTMAKVANVNIVFDSELEDKAITLTLNKVQFMEAVTIISAITNTAWKMMNKTTLLFYANSQQKRDFYTDQYVKVFFVSHADVEDVVRALRGALGIKNISADKNLNALVIKDTLGRIRTAENLIHIYDKPKPEVSIDVEIIELNRNKAHEYGLQIASAGSQGIDTSLVPDSEINLDPGPILSRSHFVLVNLPSLTFRLIKTSSDAHLVASLPIRTVQGQTGRVRFGQEVPVPQTTFAPIAQGGVNQQPITSYIYRNIGINIDITPHIHLNNDVTLDVAIESSSQAGQGYSGIPIFGTSRVEKSIRLQENETSIIAGLQKEELRTILEGIPGLSDIPGIGKMFSHNTSTKAETEIILALTPHIINALPLSPEDMQVFQIEENNATDSGTPKIHERPSLDDEKSNDVFK
jgi:general secretion pathway protein D